MEWTKKKIRMALGKMEIVECCICGSHWWMIKLYKDNKKVKLICKNCGYIEVAKL